ncbi:hypothetical protein [Nonomuraea rubra]|uniref:hypothetical protein n=1 Tax=Nonomuraea rubra TaxID=46180 RepID=UPI0036D2FAB7
MAIKRGAPPTRHRADRPTPTAAPDSLPPGQAKKITGKNGNAEHGHRLRSPGKGGGKGHK